MFTNGLRKIAALGIALCIVGTFALTAPITTLAAYYDITPFGVTTPGADREE